jgi:hypothetical protein
MNRKARLSIRSQRETALAATSDEFHIKPLVALDESNRVQHGNAHLHDRRDPRPCGYRFACAPGGRESTH